MIFSPLSADAPAALPWQRAWTVAEPVSFEGVGLHSGVEVALRILPAPAGTGLCFRRVDLPLRPVVPALAAHVVDTRLSTVLGHDGVTVQTVEHVLAALWGMGVSDAWLELDGPELPIMDGSAAPFVAALDVARVVSLEAERPRLALTHEAVTDGDRVVTSLPAAGCRISVAVAYGAYGPNGLYQAMLSPEVFAREIAPARTFGMRDEVEAMRAAGFARGGSLSNAVVFDEHGPSTALRFPDEPVRHKALDLIGDLALLGARWEGHVVAVKAGHGMHTALAKALAQPVACSERVISVTTREATP